MGVQYNTSIVTSGLIHYFDAANTKSYPGTGTTWFNLVGTTNGTLTNGPTFSTANGGVIVLDGANDFIDIPIDLSTGTYTIMGASRYVTVTSSRTFSAKNNNWLMGHWANTTQNYFAQGWVSSSGTGPGDTNWRIYAATVNTPSDSYQLYVNGVSSAGPNNLGAAGPNGFAIGSYGGTSEFSNSHISNLLVYNKVLSVAEINQNLNALRGRYSI